MGAVCRWISVWGARWARISGLSPRMGIFTKRSLRLSLKRHRPYSCYTSMVCMRCRDEENWLKEVQSTELYIYMWVPMSLVYGAWNARAQ